MTTPLLAPRTRSEPVPTPLSANRRVISREKWEQLKPVIRTLYVEEGLSFKKVAATLSRSYGFLPTRKQFNTRVHAWGFKKNTTKEERDLILRNGGIGYVGAHGKEFDHPTLERWQKEFQNKPVEDSEGSPHTSTLSTSERVVIC